MGGASAKVRNVVGIGTGSLHCRASSSVSTLARGIGRGWVLWGTCMRFIRYDSHGRLWRHDLAWLGLRKEINAKETRG